ncbi:MAG: LysR family transcriptional regulator [Lachnospirales bacterium]
MDLKEFEYVLTINEERSFSKAAKKLFISQPSLSQYINRLEGQLGITIFDRNTIPLSLTYEGEIYIEAVHNILDIIENMRKKFDDITELKKGRINIGLTPSKANNPLPLILPVFKDEYPGVEIIITEATSSELEDMLSRGIVDVCMMNLPIKGKGIEYEEITKENLFIAAPPSFVPKIIEDSSPYPKIDISELKDEQFILLHPDQRLRQIADSIFDLANIKPKIMLETRSIETAQRLSASGMGFSFVPESFAKFSGLTNQPKYYSIKGQDLNWTLVVAYRENAYKSKAVQAFSRVVKEILADNK